MERKQDTDYLLSIACQQFKKALNANNGKRNTLPIVKKSNTLYIVKRGNK